MNCNSMNDLPMPGINQNINFETRSDEYHKIHRFS